jgi:hypothetical protein
MYSISKCPCGHPSCQDWHVDGIAAVQGVKFTQAQARVVADLLWVTDVNSDERGASNPEHTRDKLAEEITSWKHRFPETFPLPPYATVPVRADLLTTAYTLIEVLSELVGATEAKLDAANADVAVMRQVITDAPIIKPTSETPPRSSLEVKEVLVDAEVLYDYWRSLKAWFERAKKWRTAP